MIDSCTQLACDSPLIHLAPYIPLFSSGSAQVLCIRVSVPSTNVKIMSSPSRCRLTVSNRLNNRNTIFPSSFTLIALARFVQLARMSLAPFLRVPHFGSLWRRKGLSMTSMDHATRRISPQSGFRSKVPFRRWWCLRYTLRPSAPQICERATGRDSSVGRATDS